MTATGSGRLASCAGNAARCDGAECEKPPGSGRDFTSNHGLPLEEARPQPRIRASQSTLDVRIATPPGINLEAGHFHHSVCAVTKSLHRRSTASAVVAHDVTKRITMLPSASVSQRSKS